MAAAAAGKLVTQAHLAVQLARPRGCSSRTEAPCAQVAGGRAHDCGVIPAAVGTHSSHLCSLHAAGQVPALTLCCRCLRRVQASRRLSAEWRHSGAHYSCSAAHGGLSVASPLHLGGCAPPSPTMSASNGHRVHDARPTPQGQNHAVARSAPSCPAVGLVANLASYWPRRTAAGMVGRRTAAGVDQSSAVQQVRRGVRHGRWQAPPAPTLPSRARSHMPRLR